MPALPLPQTAHSWFAADLVELACERSPEKRTELLCRITDAYIEQPDQRTPAERHLFEEIMMELIDKISGHHKAAASARLAEMPELPAALARRLASDGDIEVARPIIRDYRGLSEQTLLAVAKQGSQAHLHVITNSVCRSWLRAAIAGRSARWRRMPGRDFLQKAWTFSSAKRRPMAICRRSLWSGPICRWVRLENCYR